MAGDLPISGLPSATTPLAGTEALPIVQGGVTDQVTVANLTAGRAVSTGDLTITGNTIVGNTSANTLTFNAGTWTMGANYTATRAAGTLAAGVVELQKFLTTAAGDAGGTTNIRPYIYELDTTGTANITTTSTTRCIMSHQGSGTVANLRCNIGQLSVDSTGSATNAQAYLGAFILSSSGNITTGAVYSASAPTLSSTGVITTLIGFQAAGTSAASTTTAIGFDSNDMVAAITLTAGFRSQVASGTGKWNFYGVGTAANAFAGASRFGSVVAPVNTVDITGSFGRGAPVTKSADFTVATTENWLINNKAGSTCTATLPDPTVFVGRELMFKNLQAQTVVSASSNVVPLAGGAAGTAILASGAGKWCTMVADGTNWVIMASN